jgi:hypothetical protein
MQSNMSVIRNIVSSVVIRMFDNGQVTGPTNNAVIDFSADFDRYSSIRLLYQTSWRG